MIKNIMLENINLLANAAAVSTTAETWYPDLQIYLMRKFDALQGGFVSKRSNYEQELAEILNWECVNHTDYDCKYMGYEIEVKKCVGTQWFNKLRYIEPKSENNVTLILFYKKGSQQISDFVLIPSNEIRKKLFEKYPPDYDLKNLQKYQEWAPNSIQMTSSLYRKDLLKLAQKA